MSDDTATATPISQRDRDILRSFSRRIDGSDAGAHNNLGVLYYNKGMYEEGVAAFARALELDPKMQVAQRNLEVAYFHTGYYDRRVAELRDKLRVHPEDRDSRWELGRAYAAIGDAAEAVAEFNAILEYAPNDVGAIVQLGLAEKANGDLEKAQCWLERALSLDDASPLVYQYIGEVLYNRGLNDQALDALRRSIELSPENADAHYLIGFVLGDLGEHEAARAATKRAIQLNPSLSRAQANLSIDRYNTARYNELVPARQERRSSQLELSTDGHLAHYNLGLAFRQKGYYNEALKEYRLALDRNEDANLVRQAMAEVHLLKKDVAVAIELYDQILVAQDDSPKLWCERGVALHQQGEHAAAAASYRRALDLDPAYAIAHNNLGVAQYHGGDSEAAVDSFRAALSSQPTFVKAWLNLALLLFRGKRQQLALESYRQVLTVEAEQPVAWNGVGLVLAELRKFEDARNAFGRAIHARPNFAEAHYNLGFTLSNLGDFEGALRATKRALELDPYYSPQKFELAIDVEYEDPELSIAPELGGGQRTAEGVESFAFDADLLDSLFTQLAPPPPPVDLPEPAKPESVQVPEQNFVLAHDYLAKGMLDRAAVEANRALVRGAPSSEGFAILGDIFMRQGLFGEALERYRSARMTAPLEPRLLAGETRALLALDRVVEARATAETLLTVDGSGVEVLLLTAAARARAGDPGAARELLRSARRLAPARADVLKEFGDVARAAGDIDGAIAAYRNALDLDRDFAVVHYELARLLAERGEPAKAEESLLAALEAVPTYVEAMLALASVRRRFGRVDAALPPLVELLRRDPYNIDALLSLSEVLLELDRHDDAAISIDRVLRFDPRHVLALYLKGQLLADRHRYRDAIATWQRVVELEPEGDLARRARRESRTSADLLRIFHSRQVA
ncbi:MAG TPA: tetratricopeptide repeat protein [Gemmatimonadaceae bacterium]|nr:tetratricopeptide repeat protein [Gemmatimonadaceae bacterium]